MFRSRRRRRRSRWMAYLDPTGLSFCHFIYTLTLSKCQVSLVIAAAVNVLLDQQAGTLWGPRYLLGVCLARLVPYLSCLLFACEDFWIKQQKSSRDAYSSRCLHLREALVVYVQKQSMILSDCHRLAECNQCGRQRPLLWVELTPRSDIVNKRKH